MKITLTAEANRPISNLGQIERRFGSELQDNAENAANATLQRAQERVHVDTGSLRSTGRVEIQRSGFVVEAHVKFGGQEGMAHFVDYAALHEMEYPFLEPSFAETAREYEGAIWEAFKDSF